MIISKDHRYIFVHVPKTGGTSLAQVLETQATDRDILIGDTPEAQKRRKQVKDLKAAGELWKHSKLSDIDGLVTPDEMDGMFVFTLVRNPWDRAVSYYHWLRAQSFSHYAVTLAKKLEFRQFIRSHKIVRVYRAHPYSSYVTDATGRERCDLFVRLEQLEQDIEPLVTHLGFDPRPIPRLNRSKRAADYRGYFQDADAEWLARVFAVDIARFGYRFDDPARP